MSGGTLTISRTREEADKVLDMLPKVPTIFLEEAFFKTMDKYGLSFDEEDFVQGNYGAIIDELIEPLFRDGGHPDAIVFSNDEMALSI